MRDILGFLLIALLAFVIAVLISENVRVDLAATVCRYAVCVTERQGAQ